MIITSIRPQKNKKRVNIYIDDKFGFGLDLETFVKSGLKIEKELTEAEIEKIVKEGEFQITYSNILRFASFRPRSEKEFRDWLRRKKVHISLHEELFKRLKHLEFIDDVKFSRWWIEQRLHFRQKGPNILQFELKQKGIDQEIIKSAIEELVGQDVQIKKAKKFLEKKKYKWEKLTGFDKRKKISAILLSHGYGWDIIKNLTSIDD